MNELQLLRILKNTVAAVCDVSNGEKANTDLLWEHYRELEATIKTKAHQIGETAEQIATDLIAHGFIFFHGPLAKEDPEARKHEVVQQIRKTLKAC